MEMVIDIVSTLNIHQTTNIVYSYGTCVRT